MALTGVVSLARSGETVRVFQNESDLNNVFDPNSSPTLQPLDHITIYPGDFTNIDPIVIKEKQYLTILPGAKVNYNFVFDEDGEEGSLERRYEDFSGAVENIADLNLANRYQLSYEKQLARVRRYKTGSEEEEGKAPYEEYNQIDQAIEDASIGETIVVFPGDYNPENNLLKNEVTWKFLPGSTITFNPDYQSYPHALFDDSKNTTGGDDGSSVNTEIYGKGEFIIGRKDNPTPVNNDDWVDWHKYSLLAVSNSNSDIKFEAETVRVQRLGELEDGTTGKVDTYLDAIVKYENAKKLDLNIETVEFGSKHKVGNEIPSGGSFPTFLVVNGYTGSSAENEIIDLEVENIVIEEVKGSDTRETFPYLISGVNPNNNKRFNGKLKANFGGYSGVKDERGIYFPQIADDDTGDDITHAPEIILKNSNIHGQLYFAGPAAGSSKLILKENEIYNPSNAPLVLAGDSSGIDLSLSGMWLLSDDATYSIKNETGNTGFEIKVYQNSFANLPIQHFKETLHDELNNIAWSEDVESIR